MSLESSKIQLAPGPLAPPVSTPVRAPERPGTFAVIDIGSNSIRLVVYDPRYRGAVALFNEKVLCGLGRGLAKTGKLNPEGAALALENLVRFTRLARAMGVSRVELLATAAVRDAEDAPAFTAQVEALCGHPVRILSGQEEGHLSALGVAAGFPGAHGVMGDLGGGSLELVELIEGQPGRCVTLPLGPFKLMDTGAGKPSEIAHEVDRRLEKVEWLNDMRGIGAFYAVGGAWRNLARIDMEHRDYPLHVIHGYVMKRDDLAKLTAVIDSQSKRSLARVTGVTKARLEILPIASIVLNRVIRALKCDQVCFSAFGLREGYAFDLLPGTERALDPLLTTCAGMARRDARFDHMGDPLMTWSDPLFTKETREARRLRQASCLLSDLAWREHPDYRAIQALFRILHFPFVGLSHAERVFLGLAACARYGGQVDGAQCRPYYSLLSTKQLRAAQVLGLAQRLAYQVSGATREVLAQCALRFDDARELHLILPEDGTVPVGEAVEKRLIALAEALGAKAHVIGG